MNLRGGVEGGGDWSYLLGSEQSPEAQLGRPGMGPRVSGSGLGT